MLLSSYLINIVSLYYVIQITEMLLSTSQVWTHLTEFMFLMIFKKNLRCLKIISVFVYLFRQIVATLKKQFYLYYFIVLFITIIEQNKNLGFGKIGQKF